MSGLFRFDFYPKDWFLDTRDLSNAAKGIYVDLFSAMYARGGPLPYDEQELCGLCGCKTVRSLRPLLRELIEKEKLHLTDDFLVNNRTMEELAAANRRIESGRKGGKARSGDVQGEYTPNTAGTYAETDGSSVEKQGLNPKLPSPSPPIPSKKKGAGAPAGGKERSGATAPTRTRLRLSSTSAFRCSPAPASKKNRPGPWWAGGGARLVTRRWPASS